MKLSPVIFSLCVVVTLSACGGSGGSGGTSGSSSGGGNLTVTTSAGTNGSIAPSNAEVASGGTTIFTIQADAGFSIASANGCGGTLVGATYTTAPVIADCEVTAIFVVQNMTGLTQSNFIKASNTGIGDTFGDGVSLNEDGTVLVVGAPAEQSADGTQGDDARPNGAVYVYTNNGAGWSQQSYVKPSNLPQSATPPSRLLAFGDSVSISDDGTTMAVTATGELQASIEEGGVYIFNFVGGAWVEEDLLKITNADQYSQSPGQNNAGVALDGAGDTLVVAEFGDSSITNMIGGDESDESAAQAGAAHVFFRTSGVWSRQAYLKGSTVQAGDQFGSSIAISGDGNTVAIGSTEASVTNPESGSVYVFVRVAGVWSEQQRIQPATSQNQFGFSISLSHTGDVLAVGIPSDSSGGNGAGADPTQAPGTKISSGAAYVYERNGTAWTEQEFIKAGATDINDQFGRSVSLNSAGDKLAIGAIGESGNATGINGDPNNNSAAISGAAYLFSRTANVWTQDAYLKSGHPVAFRSFGGSISISGDGATIAVGSEQDASNAIGINGDETNEDALGSGAVNVFEE